MFLFDDGMATRVIELLTPCRRVIVAVEPICDFLVVPPLLTKLAYRVV